AKVSWLECKEACIPGSGDVQVTLNIGNETKTSADAALIHLWQNRVPMPTQGWPLRAWWEKLANDDTRPLIIELLPFSQKPSASVEKADFFPDAYDQFEIQAATETIPDAHAEFCLRKLVKKFSGDWPKEISGVIVEEIGQAHSSFNVKISVSNKVTAGETISSTANQPSALPPQPLWRMLLYAFIGGLILNIMPCVLPVVALKILGFINHAQHVPRRVRALGLIYAAGVLVAFLALAAIVIGVKAAGHHAG